MGKKSVNSSKYLSKAESFIVVFIVFSLYFWLNRENSYEKEPVLEEEPETVENRAKNSENAAVFFDSDVQSIVKALIKESSEKIDIASYTYSENEIVKLLEKKAKEGIQVRLAAGQNKDRSLPAFAFSNVRMKRGIYHPKFMVFDRKNVLILSANISSETTSFNNAVLFRNVPVAAKILEHEIDDVFEGKIERKCENGCSSEIGTIFFNPGKGCLNVKNEILRAKKSIKAGVYTVTLKNPVVSGLKKAVKNGVKSSVIVDNWRGNDGSIVNKRAFKYLESLGADLSYDEDEERNSRLFHHKFAEIDGSTVIFGSMNWTSAACYKNREIVVIRKDEKLAEYFEDYFDSF